MDNLKENNPQQPRYSYLATPHPSWNEVAQQQRNLDELAKKVYNLPIEEFRKIPYKPSELPSNCPTIGTDITVKEIGVTVRDGAQILVRIYQPNDNSTDHILFFNCHGGGWTVGNPQTEEAQNRLVCFHNKAVVVSPNYRKAPEYPFPNALYDVLDVLEWAQLEKNIHMLGIDINRIIVGGGSAGANLSAVIAQLYRDEGKHNIIGQVLNIPVTCHPNHFPVAKFEYESYAQNEEAPIVNSGIMRKFWNNYLPSAVADTRASPLLAESLENLPPALVQVAGMDPLRDEGIAYAEALKAAGVEVVLKIFAGMPHAFYRYPNLPPSVQYHEAIVAWVEDAKSRV